MGKKNNNPLSDYWETPDEVFAELDNEFEFEWDACANGHNTKVPGCYFDEEQDALSQEWTRTANTFWLNPPYSNVTPWLSKARLEAERGATIVTFLKADHTTGWWKEFIYDYDKRRPHPGVEIRDWPRRVKFKTPPGMVDKDGNPVKSITPPWPNVVVIFRSPENER